jgi:hypothetical protein
MGMTDYMRALKRRRRKSPKPGRQRWTAQGSSTSDAEESQETLSEQLSTDRWFGSLERGRTLGRSVCHAPLGTRLSCVARRWARFLYGSPRKSHLNPNVCACSPWCFVASVCRGIVAEQHTKILSLHHDIPPSCTRQIPPSSPPKNLMAVQCVLFRFTPLSPFS